MARTKQKNRRFRNKRKQNDEAGPGNTGGRVEKKGRSQEEVNRKFVSAIARKDAGGSQMTDAGETRDGQRQVSSEQLKAKIEQADEMFAGVQQTLMCSTSRNKEEDGTPKQEVENVKSSAVEKAVVDVAQATDDISRL